MYPAHATTDSVRLLRKLCASCCNRRWVVHPTESSPSPLPTAPTPQSTNIYCSFEPGRGSKKKNALSEIMHTYIHRVHGYIHSPGGDSKSQMKQKLLQQWGGKHTTSTFFRPNKKNGHPWKTAPNVKFKASSKDGGIGAEQLSKP